MEQEQAAASSDRRLIKRDSGYCQQETGRKTAGISD
jgi:hypothetical protein